MELDPGLREVVDALGSDVIWVSGLGWLHWDGTVWDEAGEAATARMVSRYAEERGNPPKADRAVKSLLHQARGAVEVTVKDLDPDPYLLNCPNGVVNLRTGELRPHSRARLTTKTAAVDYDPAARSDVWDQVLAAIPEPERDLLQTRIAWAVSGGPMDSATLIHGPGVSGKSTFMQAVRSALGTYALATDGELLNMRSPFDVINLLGVRLVVMEDVGPDDMDRVKRLTSMGEFTARRIRQDPVTFNRSHSVLLATNLHPSNLTTDEGSQRRLCPVEFQALAETVPGLHRHIREPEALRAALRWIVEGAVRGYAAA